MTSPSISKALREHVKQRARFRCEYCQSSEWLNGIEGEIDHIIPRAEGGTEQPDNLCLACTACNGYKQAKTTGIDPEIGQAVTLFHPRQQRWGEHFAWNDDGTQILGLSSCGRATIEALRLNHPLAVSARAVWVRAGYHPPARTAE